jgi:hypothetical protein
MITILTTLLNLSTYLAAGSEDLSIVLYGVISF